MKKSLFLIAMCMLFLINVNAQNATIKGKVIVKNEPAANASIALLSSPEAKLVKAAVANANGAYEIDDIPAGTYILQISTVGYKTSTTEPFTLTANQQYTVPLTTLVIVTKADEVATVVGGKKKPLIEVKADKMIFNVESSINAIGSNAFELLRKSPGVVIDKDDNLQLKGKNGVRIFIDGKPTVFDARDLAAYLKTINSADIEAIEFITNPSARYEAEGNAGIINIKLKKTKKLGYNGSVNLGFAIGIHPKTNSSVTMNYRKNKWNVFGNYSNNFGKNQNNFTLYRIQLDSIYDQNATNIDNTRTHNFKIGADYSADKSNTFGVVVTTNLADGTNTSNSTTPISNKNTSVKGSTLTAGNTMDMRRNNYNLNFNYRYADTNNIEVGVDADKGWFDNKGISYQPNEYRYVTNLLNPVYKIYRNITPTKIDINSLKLDIAFPVKKGKLEIGGKYAKVTTTNASDFFNVINGNDIIDQNLTNKFTYKENINALYTNYNKQLNQKWNIQAGVRMENTISEGDLTSFNAQSDAKVKRNYTDFFPSAAVSYSMNMKNSFNFTYSRRIDRPGYQDLNPFEYRLDELTFQKGNAFLRPQYSNVVELTHTYKYMYNTTLSYTHVNDFTTQFVDTFGTARSFITQKNLGTQQVASINFSAPVQFYKWWSLFGNININYNKYKAKLADGRKVDVDVTSGSLFAQNTFSLKKGFNIELSGFYQLPTVWGGTFESKGIGGMDVGVSSPLFNNKATVKFSFTDLLHTMRWQGTNTLSGAYMVARGRWESQQFKVNFNYRFGNNQIKANNRKTGGNDDEKKRAQKSGGGFGGGN